MLIVVQNERGLQHHYRLGEPRGHAHGALHVSHVFVPSQRAEVAAVVEPVLRPWRRVQVQPYFQAQRARPFVDALMEEGMCTNKGRSIIHRSGGHMH